MDPNTALQGLRRLVLEIGRTLDHDQAPDMVTVNDLCEAIDGLDQWISRGGFLPTPWVPQPAPSTGEAISPDAALAQLRTAMSVYEDVRGGRTAREALQSGKSADQMRDAGRSLDDWLSRGGSLPQPWTPATDGVTITREQLQAWAGRQLTDDEIDTLNRCIPHSSIPDAIGTMVAVITGAAE